jgi:UDP-N-acetyl-D-mannosaminuronic acid transferase (WecB/TagA/CpsF family)
MASSSKIHLTPSQQPVFYLPGISPETAELTSELLQENHEKHHIFFNYAGYHVRPSLA